MSKKQTKETLYGSGMIYSNFVADDAFPVVADTKKMTAEEATKIAEFIKTLCVDDNRIGMLKGGIKWNFAVEKIEDEDDLGELKVSEMKKETATAAFNLFNVDGATIAAQYGTASFSEQGENTLTAIGGLEHLDTRSRVFVFLKTNAAKPTYYIFKGKNVSGLDVEIVPDSVKPLAVSVDCESLNTAGNKLWIFTKAKQETEPAENTGA